MTENFQEYYDSFKDARNEAMNVIRKMPEVSNISQRSVLEQDAKSKIDEVQRYFRILEQEGRGGDAHEKRKMQIQLRSCQSDIEKLKNNLNKALLVGQAQKNDTNLTPQDQTAAYQQRLNRTGDHLDHAKATVVEIEQIGANITTNLARDRELLEQAQGNVQDVRADTEEAKWYIGSLARKALSNIILMWVIILCLIAGIIYALYKKLVK